MATGRATGRKRARFDGEERAWLQDTRSAGEVNAADGSGWHASTWELHHGLDVREGLPEDALPDELLMAYLVTQGIGD